MNYDIHTKDEILDTITAIADEYNGLMESLSKDAFISGLPGKWTIANNIEHLINTNTVTTLAFLMPRPVLGAGFGKHSGASRDLKELIRSYQLAISSGSGSPLLYVPKVPFISKDLLKKGFNLSVESLIDAADQWTEADLDIYLLPHPILGKLTAREMLGFTAYHMYHHLNTIKTLAIYAAV